MAAINDLQSEWDEASPVKALPAKQPIQAEWDAAAPQPAPQRKPGFYGTMGGNLKKRLQNISAEINAPVKPYDILKKQERTLRVAGQVAGGAFDVIGQTAMKGLDLATPGEAPKWMKDAALGVIKSPVGQQAIAAMQKGMGYYKTLKDANPNLFKDIEAAANLLGIMPIGAAAKPTAQVIKQTAKRLAEKTPGIIDKELSAEIRRGIEKSLRPSVESTRTYGQTSKYFQKAQSAVETIVKNKAKLNLTDELGDTARGLPKSIKQFSEAIHNTKKEVWSQGIALVSQAEGKAARIDLTPVVGELKTIAKHKALNDLDPAVASYAADLAERLEKRGHYTPMETQDAITKLNASLKSFYRNPSYDTASRAYVDEMLAGNLRKDPDSVVEKATGEGSRVFREQYGALKHIERDVNRRSIVAARQNIKGLLDFTDVFTGYEAVCGILSLNPAVLGAATTGKGIAKLWKWANDPNRIVTKMFGNAEKLMEKRAALTKPAVLTSRVVPQAKIPPTTIPVGAGKPQVVEAESAANE